MRLALRELRRRPSRFGVATGVLTLIVVLLLFLGGLLDGLFLGSTGAISAQRADAFVYSSSARDSFLRSRIEPELRRQVEDVDGVERVGGLGIGLLSARVPGEDESTDVALIGYELAADGIPAPPEPGTAWADRRLEAAGVAVGDTLEVGPARSPIEVVGWVENASYLLQGGLWMPAETWRATLAANRPDLQVGDDVFQVLVVEGSGTPAELVDRIDGATAGATSSLTPPDAELSIPGTREQRSTFLQIIYTTLAIAAVVIGLFFSLLTLERTGLYGVLKALGSSSSQLFAGVVTQAVVTTGIAVVLGGLLTLGLAAVSPPGIPLQLTVARAAFVAVGMLVASIAGSVVSLRRVVRIDPASAIGTAS